VIVCPRCGTKNPREARFCLNCGSPVGSVSTGEERKVVTVLFCDLVGFTERSDRADPEDVKAMLRVYHTLLKRTIEHFGGTVDKFIGDAVLGVFGAPVGHEDDPERAVRAGLQVLEDVEQANRERPGLDLAVRIGINTGEAVIAFGQGPQIGESVTGDVVNTASRLQNVAATGTIVVGEAAHHATSAVFEYEELPPVTVKGKAEALAIWRPVRARSLVGVDVREQQRTAFVGRAEESAILRQTFRKMERSREQLARVGSPQLVTVVGEPGVGKTRLLREFSTFIDELPDLIRWRQGRCLPYGDGVGFWGFAEIVKAQAGILDSDDPGQAGSKLADAVDAVVEDPSQRDWIRRRLAPLIGAGDDSTDVPREELFTAWRRFVEALAYEGRLVLVFEDLHWADVPMLAFIEHLIDAGERPFMVVCAARPELFDAYPRWGEDRRNAIRLSLPPLTDGETAVLLSSLLERAVLPAATQSILIERSGGNPLFAEEFVQLLVDRGLIDLGNRDRPVAELHDIPVPESLQALIGSRLDQLPHEDKSLLQDAAVIGKVFWSGALAALCGCDEPSVHDRLTDVLRRQLVRPSRTSSLQGQTEYTFWHALIRDVAYGQIPRAGREQKHLAIARWLKATVPDRISDFAEELAYHHAEALELARASGVAIPTDVQAEAASAFLLAGERAAPLDAVRATGYFRKALELMTADHPQRPRAAARAAEMAEAQGDYIEGEQLYVAAIAGYRVLGDTLGLGEALGLLARTHARRGEVARSEQLMTEAIEVLEAEPPSRELARIYSRKTGELLTGDRNAECLEWAEKTLELATRLDLRDEIVRALQFRGAARCELGDDERGLQDLREAIRLGEEGGLGQALALARANYAFQLWFREGPEAALEVWRGSQLAAETRGFSGLAQMARMGQLETLFDLGRWDEVLEICREIQAWIRPRGEGTELSVYATIFQTWVRLRRGETRGLAELADELLERARPFGGEFGAPAALLVAETRRAEGDRPGARRALDGFTEITETSPNFRALFAPIAARALVALGDADGAERIIPAHSDARTDRHRVSLLTARAVVAEARGLDHDALAGYKLAISLWRAHGFRLELGLTLIGAARCLLELDRRDDAADALVEARDVLRPLHAAPALAEIADLLGEDLERRLGSTGT
jgi:class 3 adenylate cyclase/tetratricopeptide (TPR) repeat protein